MANTTHHERIRSEAAGHRADEIHVHRREQRRLGVWPWLVAIAIALFVLWALFGRSGEATRAAVTPCDPATLSFATGSSRLSQAERAQLETLSTCLKENGSRRVRLEGRATPEEGTGVARERASTIARELRSMGVPSAQFSVGIAGVVCHEDSDACARRNRTVSTTSLRRL